ncbi:hypothetical protein LFM09_17810 [Lentzea alba]
MNKASIGVWVVLLSILFGTAAGDTAVADRADGAVVCPCEENYPPKR